MSVIKQVTEIISQLSGSTVLYDPPVESARTGSTVEPDSSNLHPSIRNFIKQKYPNGLFRHQQAAVESVLNGQHTVVATRTSSGKSLIYSLPVLDSIAKDRDSTALFLFPQKALANDQQLKLREMAAEIIGIQDMASENPLLIHRYDGSTPSDLRKQVRAESQIVLSNPDMLHLGVMQFHANWQKFFSKLKYVAVDECHEYRGVFGTNVGYILRRLRQICAKYGSDPTFVATSATVHQPASHMRNLTGLDFQCIGPEMDSSRQGARKFWIVKGDEHFYDTGRKLAKALAEAGLTVLVFCPSRVSAERMIARTVKPEELDDSYIRVYRSGLSASQREEIEDGLRTKSVRLVFSTSALELGIDIGEIDVVLCVGLPHTMMSLWQRAGRSARGGREGATIFLPAETPIDTFYSQNPNELFERDHEPLVLNLQNRRLASQHYACAVQEQGGDDANLKTDLLGVEISKVKELREAGKLNDDIFYCTDPHIEVNIRSGGDRSFKLYVDDEEIGEIDYFHLLRECYPNAIYRHGGKGYRVTNVLRKSKIVRLKREYSRNETSAHLQRRIKVKSQFRVADYQKFMIATAGLDVTEFLVSVSEKGPSGATVMVWNGSSGIVPYRLPTEGTFIAFDRDFWASLIPRLGNNPGSTLLAVERLLASLFPTVTGPCDTQDYSSAVDNLVTNQPAIFLYDTVYDGVDLTKTAFDHLPELIQKALERVEACACTEDTGCFQCIANPFADELSSKTATKTLLREILVVLENERPICRESERDFDATFLEETFLDCSECGHRLPVEAKFCSECGTRMGA